MDEAAPSSILLVDDDEAHLAHLQASLQSAGYPVVTAASAGEAIRKIRDNRLALVFTELRLPSASGLDVLDEARKRDPLTVGIVLTGHSSVVESTLQALRQGAYDYLLKPCTASTLAAAARRGMEHYRMKRALSRQNAELEKLELKLEDKSRMIQNVSHELKNPLSVVCGYSAYLLDGPQEPKPEDLRKSLEAIHSNSQRINRLLEELLDSSRLAAHKIHLHREGFSAESLVRQMAEDTRFEAERKGLALSWECACAGTQIYADHARVMQVLSNLLGNSLKFTPPGGIVNLSAQRDGDFARFCVQDTGVGIASEDIPRLFDRFYQAENTKQEHQGLGLGLEICRGLVELHGGRIWAQSVLGLGSSFYFTLPLVAS